MVGLLISRNGRTVRHELPDRGAVVLGCEAACDIVIEAEGVLPRHARVERSGAAWRVVCLDATGALVIDGTEVASADLGEGDRFDLGAATVHIGAGSRRSRLASLGGFEQPAGDEPAPRSRRIVIDPEGARVPTELPDVAHEIRTLRRILEVNKRLARVRDEEELIVGLLDAALALSGAGRVFLLHADDDGRPEVRASRTPAGEPVAGAATAFSPAVAARVLEGRLQQVIEDLRRDPDALGDGAAEKTVRSVLCVPFPGEARAALYLDNVHEPELWSALDAELLQTLAEQAAICLERVRLESRHREQAAELEAETARSAGLNDRLAELVARRTAELREAREDLARVDGELHHRYKGIVGRGPAMLATLRQVDRIADTDVPVLFEGESGTGKELLARALHAGSRRGNRRFVAENCAALPDTLLENELFGHERGAFTGADAAAEGLFERADGGTLFLDEVGDMSPSLQKRLLRVLQEGEVRRVGGASVRKVDVRIVTATNRDLLSLVGEGRFREDLYYRLAVVKVRVPPLRERREDIPELVHHFLARFVRDGAKPSRLADEALDTLVRHDWPGNVRQLENEVRRAVALGRGVVGVEGLSREVRDGPARIPEFLVDPGRSLEGRDLRALVEELEVRLLREVLEREAGNITRTATVLGLSRLGLRKKMHRYGISKPQD